MQDEGLGIPTDQQSLIFGRFMRADNVRRSGIRGTGLRALHLSRTGGAAWRAHMVRIARRGRNHVLCDTASSAHRVTTYNRLSSCSLKRRVPMRRPKGASGGVHSGGGQGHLLPRQVARVDGRAISERRCYRQYQCCRRDRSQCHVRWRSWLYSCRCVTSTVADSSPVAAATAALADTPSHRLYLPASILEQICKRLDRRAAPEIAPDRANSLPAGLTFLSFAVTFRQAALPLLDTVSANTHADLNPEIVIDHLRARAMTEANAVIDQVSSRVAEAQRFASARFRDAIEVARRSHRIGAASGDNV